MDRFRYVTAASFAVAVALAGAAEGKNVPRRSSSSVTHKRGFAMMLGGLAFLFLAATAGAIVEPLPGRALYFEHCARCHGADATGDGPDAAFLVDHPANLRAERPFDFHDDERIAAFVLEGRRLPMRLRSAAFSRSLDHVAALYDFLKTLPTVDWAGVEEGEGIFFDRCTPCHDLYGGPKEERPPGVEREPRDLSDPAFRESVTDEELVKLVRHGKNRMPALVPRITAKEAKALVTYVRFLSPGLVLYDRFCLSCHGPRGEGAESELDAPWAPRFAFDEEYFESHDPAVIRTGIWHMLQREAPSMPHFAGEIDAPELRAILKYLRSLPPDPGDQ